VILIIDNYDSFTFNLVQYVGELISPLEVSPREVITVLRNDAISADQVLTLNPQAIIISPGPCTPNEAGISIELIRKSAGRVPLLGVCLGHQAIGAAFGATVKRANKPLHGKSSTIRHDGRSIFAGLDSPFVAARYHSLVIARESLPAELEVLAVAEDDGEIMALQHRVFNDIVGVQFHPESILTSPGKQILRAFLNLSTVGLKDLSKNEARGIAF
jgi:anthranilate synthase/aminodeoxychorismate synthase-like glutamine amidotransferase